MNLTNDPMEKIKIQKKRKARQNQIGKKGKAIIIESKEAMDLCTLIWS